MIKSKKRILALGLAIHFFLFEGVGLLWAKKVEIFDPHRVSVALLSHPSSEKDRPFVEKTVHAIRTDLQKIPFFHVVSTDHTKTLIRYQADVIQTDAKLTDAERYLGLAKNHWFDHQYPEAEATVDRAILSFRKQKQKGDLLTDALLTKAMILKETKRTLESRSLFEEVLKINPGLTMEKMPLAGRSKKIFNETKKDLLQRHAGSLDIKTTPPAAVVYVNGIKKGVSPLVLQNLPEGSYLLTFEASHYQKIVEPVQVTPNTTQFVHRKLQWARGRSDEAFGRVGVPAKSDEVIQDEIKKAVKVGEAMKVDKVILVSTEKRGVDELLVVRTIDTALKAAYNPIGISFDELKNSEAKSMQKIVAELDDQARLHVLDNPQKYLEPDLGDVRVLRRKKPFVKTPLFYALVGLVVGGAAGTAAGILLTQDSDHNAGIDEGGIEVGFE